MCVCVCVCVCVCSSSLTFGRAESSGCRDHGEGGAAVDRAQIVLHVGTDVGVGRGEVRVPYGHVGGQADQGDVRDNRATGQSMGSARERA